MQCAICGNEIRVGESRVPTDEGTVHESCRGGEPTDAVTNTRRPDGHQARFRALVLLLSAVAVLYASLRYVVSAVRRRLG